MKIESATGLLYTAELLPGGAEQARNVDWKSVFGAEIVSAANPPPGAPSIDLHIVGGETIPDTLNSGGFCGEDPTYAIAMATGLVIEGRDQAILAAFKGATWPPVNASDLCGTFSYVPPARAMGVVFRASVAEASADPHSHASGATPAPNRSAP